MNTSFLPNSTFQFVWDSTSLSALKTCPRYYYYSIVQGYTHKQIPPPLSFGLLFHAGQEHFHKLRAFNTPHDEAIHQTIKHLAPRLHELEYPSPDTSRTPMTLIRALVWHFDFFKDEPLHTLILHSYSPWEEQPNQPNQLDYSDQIGSRPAVELSFKFPFWNLPSPVDSKDTEIFLAGHFDRIVSFQGDTYFMDYKTTKYLLDARFFEQFSPSNQIDFYTLASQVVLPEIAVGGIIDGIQLSPNFNRFHRHFELRSTVQTQEFIGETQDWIYQAKFFSEQNSWPKNETSCNNYGGCVFRDICSKSPHTREIFLQSNFVQRVWDPNVPRN